ncbi:hypothetical protein ACWFMI_24875 [Nocardiopsis terrae]|uniref:hypothetical protein n=1 Tax=Streptomyces sp. NPDC057554 TaxID=3350538 RepID=UPI00367FB1FE
MTTTAPTVYDIKPGDIVAIPDYKGREERVVVTRTQEYDGVMYLTDDTGWEYSLDSGDKFRYIHRARR